MKLPASMVVMFLAMTGTIQISGVGATPREQPIIYQGVIVSDASTPLPGVTVGLYLDTSVDEPRVSPLLATAVTDDVGGFVLRSTDSGAVRARAAMNDGHGNFYIMAVSADATLLLESYFSREFQGGRWVGDEGRDTREVVLSRGAPGVLPLRRSVGRALQRSMSAEPGTRACGGSTWTTLSQSLGWSDVGEFHTVGGMSGWFSYAKSNTADSDIGVGVSGGTTGPWSLSGAIHIGSGNASTETWVRGPNWSHRVRTRFLYVKQRQYTGCGQPLDSYRVKATAYAAGALDGTDESSLDHRCDVAPYSSYAAPHAAGTRFDRSSRSAVTWNAGVSVFGATLSTRSGYSTNVWAHWDFSTRGVICGNNAVVPSATRIWAGT